MNAFAQNGEEPSAKGAMKFVSNDFKLILREMLGSMDAKSLKEYLKPEHIKGFQQEKISEYQAKQQPFAKQPKPAAPQAEEPQQDKPKVVHSRHFFKNNRFI